MNCLGHALKSVESQNLEQYSEGVIRCDSLDECSAVQKHFYIEQIGYHLANQVLFSFDMYN